MRAERPGVGGGALRRALSASQAPRTVVAPGRGLFGRVLTRGGVSLELPPAWHQGGTLRGSADRPPRSRPRSYRVRLRRAGRNAGP
jgi:hypothetical protein